MRARRKRGELNTFDNYGNRIYCVIEDKRYGKRNKSDIHSG